MNKQNSILKKFRKHIALSLILSILLFSSGQAYIISNCECNHSEQNIVESINCCGEVVKVEIEESSCCSSESSNVISKFESTTSHECADCSHGCSVDENIEYTSPTLFTSISFSLKKIDKIESVFDGLSNEVLSTSEKTNRLTNNQKDEIPKLFGKDLLIQTHTLKIPLIIV